MNLRGTTEQPEGTDGVGHIPHSACPLLGLRDDPATHALFPRRDHECGVDGVGAPSLDWQAGYCLSTQHARCPHFVTRKAEPGSAGEPAPRRSGRSRRLIVTMALVALAALLGTGGVLAAMLWTVLPGSATPPDIATPGQAGQVQSTPPAPSPTPRPTPATASQAEPPAQHIVAAGETLGEIAERYDTTVAELVRLNQITNPSNIPVGMVLQLPTPAAEPGGGTP